jgi:serine/threonine protein kinase/Tol biopolymer transport system component
VWPPTNVLQVTCAVMAVGPGVRLGPYEITVLLGAGGMGEVYRARDTKLGRDVAIKVLPEAFTRDSERLARFEREARVLAALNHPHVGSIYGLEEAGGIRALVLELVEGESLAERIRRGRLPMPEALRIASQIGSALDAAHRKGIVHRDLKPANIKLTPDGAVKVLDFGLAKTADLRAPDVSQSTIAVDGTRAGVVLGTASYMSPEQARGQPVDARTDVWAFGCVLYEMLSGQRAFDGRTVSDAIARVIEREPDWSRLPRRTPPPIRALLKQCLAKEPFERTPDIATARGVIDLTRVPTEGRSITRPLLISAATITAALLVAANVWLRPKPFAPTSSSSWEQITDFPDAATQPALSPDGRMLVFIRGAGTLATAGEVYLKMLPSGETMPLTRDGLTKMDPVFSPDGTRVVYTVTDPSIQHDWNTWVVPIVRGEPRLWLRNASGLTWSGPTQLLFAEFKGTAHKGIVTSTESRTERREVYFTSQPGFVHRSSPSRNGQWLLVTEEVAAALRCRLLPSDGSSAGRIVGPQPSLCTNVAWSPDGQWMYLSARTGDFYHLWRQRFPDGDPEQITTGENNEQGLAIAADGRSLVTSVGQQRRGVWIRDASGERQISLEGNAYWPLFSSDGQRLCFRLTRGLAVGRTPSELWMTDLGSGRMERIFPGQLVTQYDLSLDDRVVATVAEPDGKARLWVAWLDGREPPRRLGNLEGDSPRIGIGGDVFFAQTAKDGRRVLFRTNDAGTTVEQAGSEELGFVVGTVSPENRWVSSGRPGADHVAAYPIGGGPTVAVFANATSRLRWSPDGTRVTLSIQTGQASAFGFGRSYVLPADADTLLPRMPLGGFKTEEEIASVPGVELIPHADVALSPVAGVYAFSKITVTRNLYRVPLR